MGDKENRADEKLSAKGRTAYGRDRATEAAANRGTFDASQTKLFAGYYNNL